MTAFVVVLSLLVAQLAVASYVCPAQADAAAMAAMMAAGQPCEGMDQAQPTLCHQHAAAAAQSFESVKKLPAASLPAIVQMLVLPSPLEARSATPLPVATANPVRPPPDPLFLSTLRLRV
jgi:hypothetical protein